MPESTCPACGETRFLRIIMAQPSERFPRPIWRFECKKCGATWKRNENTETGHERD